MKKNYKYRVWYDHAFKKTFLVMRLVLVISLVCIMQSFALDSYTQNSKISISVREMKLDDILMKLESETNYRFAYNKTDINVNQVYTIDISDAQIKEVLDKLFADKDISYKIIDQRQVILSKSSRAYTVSQQQLSVSGKVTDSSGAPLPGVTVVVKRTTQGTITDADGNYSLVNVPGDGTLVFSFVGMKNQEIPVAGKTNINVTLAEETIGIEEVVAIGYGTIKKKDLTGAVASVKFENQANNANISPLQAVQGVIPGLNVSAVTSAGEDPALTIRGTTSLSTGQSPLIVVDGIIFAGSLSEISTNDIERIDVLKDASSAAIYGSRSANGVIIITTKKGTSKKPVFNFNTYHGVQTMAKKIEMYDADRYLQYILDYRAANDMDADPSKIEDYLDSREVEGYRSGTETNWADLVTQTGLINQYDLSVSGRTKRTNYYLSGSFTDQQGIRKGDDFTRTTLRANFSNNITDWLKIGMNVMFSRRDYSGVEVPIFSSWAVHNSPLVTPYDEDGELVWYPVPSTHAKNPLLWLNAKDKDIRTNLFGILFTDIKIPKVAGLSFHFDYADNFRFSNDNQFWPSKNTFQGLDAPNGYGSKSNSENRHRILNNILSYSRDFDKHNINATVLYSREKAEYESTNFTAKDFSSEALGWNAMQLASNLSGTSSANDNTSESFMARLIYGYDSKYILTATFRRDGFSGFSEKNKYANFPSLSLGWLISDENFVEPVSWLNILKLRLSYGVNGNQALGSYGSLAQMKTVPYYFGENRTVGAELTKMGNSDLTWEKTQTYNVGLDFGVLDSRLSGEINVYKGTTSNQLVERSLSSMNGYENVWTNLGEIQNKGIEFMLNSMIVSTEDFNWKAGVAFSLNRNKINQLYGTDADGDGVEDDDIGNSWFVGKSVGAIYGWKTDGIYQQGDNIPEGFYAGQFRVVDVNGDGELSDDDRTIIGYTVPNYRFSIQNEFNYKNVSLSLLINSVQGGDGYYLVNSDDSRGYARSDVFNLWKGMEYWTPDNPTNEYRSLQYVGQPYSPQILEDRSFIRVQDVTLAYNFGNKILSSWGIHRLKFYVSGKNLLTLTKKYDESVLTEKGYFTNFTGRDPETGAKILSNDGPVYRTFVAGININF